MDKDNGVQSGDCLVGFPNEIPKNTLQDLLETTLESSEHLEQSWRVFQHHAPVKLLSLVSKAELMALSDLLFRTGGCLLPISDYLYSDGKSEAWDGRLMRIALGVFLQSARHKATCHMDADLESFWDGTHRVFKVAAKHKDVPLKDLLRMKNGRLGLSVVENLSPVKPPLPPGGPEMARTDCENFSMAACTGQICSSQFQLNIRQFSICQDCCKCGTPLTLLENERITNCFECGSKTNLPPERIVLIQDALEKMNIPQGLFTA